MYKEEICKNTKSTKNELCNIHYNIPNDKKIHDLAEELRK